MRSLPFLAGAAFLLVHQAASADTLRDALTRAYNSNPTLTAQRANVRAVDENVPIARSGGLPSLEASAGYTENIVKDGNIRNNFAAPERQINAGLNLTVPLLTFGAVGGAVRAADKRVEAARLGLRGTEADLFTAVVGAYMDVIRDDAVVTLNQQNVKMLDVNLKANKERYEVGDLNSTDVAQSRARQALGRSQLQTAEARLISSRENYIRLVGVAPGLLETPPPLPNMPADPDTAVDIALDNNANLLAAKKAREAADEDITIAKAGRLPRLNGVAGGNYVDYLKTLGNGTLPRSDQTIPSASIGLALQVPLYQGGRPSAQIRQAQARSGQAIEQTVEAERTVVAQTRSAYAIWKSSLGVIESAEVGVSANKESLDGVRAENQVGTRTILDVLNAQQELLNSRVTMVTAQRDAYVAGFALLAAMGRAEARDLGLDGGPLYDPKVNYDRVRNHLGDWETDSVPQGIATGTSEIPAQGADPRLPLDPSLNVAAMAPE